MMAPCTVSRPHARRPVHWLNRADGSLADAEVATAFLGARWGFVPETSNGTEDIWWIFEGRGYPRLWWEAAER